MSDLVPAVTTIVNRCLGIRPGEDVLVTADNATRAAGEPATLTVEGGRGTDAEGGRGHRFLDLRGTTGAGGTNLAALGIGTDERAQLTGNVLEDEKILGTAHVAFGASAGIGGTVSVPVDLDVVILEPALEVGGERGLDAGRFALEAQQ